MTFLTFILVFIYVSRVNLGCHCCHCISRDLGEGEGGRERELGSLGQRTYV